MVDDILRQLDQLEPVMPGKELSASIRMRAHRVIRRNRRSERVVVAVTMVAAFTYLSWALQFTSALYG